MSFVLWMNSGKELVLKPYQKEILNVLNQEPKGSKEIWETVKENGYPISRASVINFLNLIRDLEYIVAESASGKGGMHELYAYRTGADKSNIYFKIALEMIKLIRQDVLVSDKQWNNLLGYAAEI